MIDANTINITRMESTTKTPSTKALLTPVTILKMSVPRAVQKNMAKQVLRDVLTVILSSMDKKN
jgi:hypothetical protein